MAGPFYFAWVAASETSFDPNVHNREDEDVFGFTVEHSEGDFAGLEIEIRNPRVGLLAPARKVHAFLAMTCITASSVAAKSFCRTCATGARISLCYSISMSANSSNSKREFPIGTSTNQPMKN
jgi:hypothetical protein